MQGRLQRLLAGRRRCQGSGSAGGVRYGRWVLAYAREMRLWMLVMAAARAVVAADSLNDALECFAGVDGGGKRT